MRHEPHSKPAAMHLRSKRDHKVTLRVHTYMVDHTAVHECDARRREERTGGRKWSGEGLAASARSRTCVSGSQPGQRLLALCFDKASRPTVFCRDQGPSRGLVTYSACIRSIDRTLERIWTEENVPFLGDIGANITASA